MLEPYPTCSIRLTVIALNTNCAMSPLIAGSAAVASMPLSSWLDDAIYIYPVGNPPLSSAAGSYPRARTIIATASSNVTLSSGLKVPSVSPTTKPCWSAVFIAPVAQ